MTALSPAIRPPVARAAILARMVGASPGQKLGRTAVTKLMYFLQELKGIELGYDFRLYTYGPFDSEVLADLRYATSCGLLQEKTVLYPRGYGYEITVGSGTGDTTSADSLDPATVQAVTDIVLTFASLSAAELELKSTILYVDRELERQGASTLQAIADRVREVKPHFAASDILDRVRGFSSQGWLRSVPST